MEALLAYHRREQARQKEVAAEVFTRILFWYTQKQYTKTHAICLRALLRSVFSRAVHVPACEISGDLL